MGWITAILASDLARKALGLMLAAITLVFFLLNLRRAGERAGRLAASSIWRWMSWVFSVVESRSASRRPADRDALAQRLRDGQF